MAVKLLETRLFRQPFTGISEVGHVSKPSGEGKLDDVGILHPGQVQGFVVLVLRRFISRLDPVRLDEAL